jgi:FkbM family methyltransferase
MKTKAVISYQLYAGSLLKRAIFRLLVSRIIRNRAQQEVPVTFCSPNDLIGVEVIASGTFEGEFLAFTRVLLTQHVIELSIGSQRTAILDIGANIGTHALFFSSLTDSVFAFEPNPAVALVCRANALAAQRENLKIFEVALSDRTGRAQLYAPVAREFGWATLEPNATSGGAVVQVETDLADTFVAAKLDGARIVLVKIDVEGHEANVLMGMPKILAHHRPIVIFESLSLQHLKRCKSILADSGYEQLFSVERSWDRGGRISKLVSIVKRQSAVYLREIDLSSEQRHSMVVALPWDKSGSLGPAANGATPEVTCCLGH